MLFWNTKTSTLCLDSRLYVFYYGDVFLLQMPVYGLNVTSMLKHKTLVLTAEAVNTLEEKLLFALRRVDIADKVCLSSTHGNRVC